MKNQSSTEPTCSSTSIIQPVPSTSSSSSLHPSSSFSGSTSLLSQQILTEDEYTSSLDYIIRRDFFPTLGLQQLEEEYLRALDGGDETEIDRTVTRLVQEEERSGKIGATPRTERGENTGNKRQKRESGTGGSYSFNPTSTPGETPLRSQVSNWDQTPISTDRSVSSPVPISRSNPPRRIASGSSKPIDLSLSLSAFQANYTSEDNASFNQLMARNNLKNKEKNSWAFEAERRNNEKRLEFKRREIRECEKGRELMEGAREERKMIEMEKRGLIEASKESDGSEEHLEKEKEKEKDLQIIRTEEEPDNSTSSKDSRPSILQSWKFKALNPFFFPPDSEISTAYQRTSSLPTTFNKTQDSFLLESNRPKVNRPELRVDNMRFPEGWSDEKGKVENEEEDEDGGGSSPSSSRIDKAIRGEFQRAYESQLGFQKNQLYILVFHFFFFSLRTCDDLTLLITFVSSLPFQQVLPHPRQPTLLLIHYFNLNYLQSKLHEFQVIPSSLHFQLQDQEI